MSWGKKTSLKWLLLAALCWPAAAQAQLNSNGSTVNLNAVVNPRLAVAVSPATVNFAIPPNSSAQGDSPVTIQTAWSLPTLFSGLFADVSLYAYFSAAPAALTNGAGSNIPAARVRGSVNGGGFAPMNAANPFSPAGLLIFQQTIFTLGPFRTGVRTDTLNLEIDVTGLGLPPGTYTGVLRIQARAI